MTLSLSDVVVVSACRTPLGRFGGTLKDIPAYNLGAAALRGALVRAGLSGEVIDEVILGHCRQAGNGPNPARTAALKAGLPLAVPAQTVNMACPSGMKAVALAAQAVRLNEARIILAGGMESMSTMPYLLKGVRWQGFKMGDKTLEDGWSDSLDPICEMSMGETGENLVRRYGLTREEQDTYALESQEKAARAQEAGLLQEEIVSFPLDGQTPALFARDESLRRDTTLEKLRALKPVFRPDGTITAGNACGLSDGAAAMVVTTREVARAEGLTPLFSLLGYAQVAVENAYMGEGPAISLPRVLQATGLKLKEIDLLEVTEAFAAQVLANERVLGWDRSRVNIHGGTLALGHPTGTTGARLLVTLYYALKHHDRELGLASLCGAGGVTTAMIIRHEA